MSALSVRLPESLHQFVREAVAQAVAREEEGLERGGKSRGRPDEGLIPAGEGAGPPRGWPAPFWTWKNMAPVPD